jgi:protein SCO1
MAAPATRIAHLAIATSAAAVLLALVGCGSSGSDTSVSTSASRLHGTPTSPPYPAPTMRLRNYNGQEVDLKSFRGKAVLVTFIYTHCPDICPIIIGNLHTAQNELGAEAKQLQIVAVSVDPKRDTPRTVKAFLKKHQMTGRMDYLIGSRPQLERTWKAWGIGAQVSKKSPEQVEHSAYVFGIDAGGMVETLYPGNFKPGAIVDDVPLLATNSR